MGLDKTKSTICKICPQSLHLLGNSPQVKENQGSGLRLGRTRRHQETTSFLEAGTMPELKMAVHTTMAHVPTTSPTISKILASVIHGTSRQREPLSHACGLTSVPNAAWQESCTALWDSHQSDEAGCTCQLKPVEREQTSSITQTGPFPCTAAGACCIAER